MKAKGIAHPTNTKGGKAKFDAHNRKAGVAKAQDTAAHRRARRRGRRALKALYSTREG